MIKRNVLHSPRLLELKKVRRRAILNKIIFSFLGLIAIFSLLAYLSRLNSLNITGIQIVGNKIIDTETIKQVVGEQIAGKYLWLFPKTNIGFYPKNSIKSVLQDKFKRIKDINLSIQNRILEVSIDERKALYTWCGTTPPVDTALPDTNNNSQKCYFVDEDGYIFDEAPYFSGEIYFKFYGLTDTGLPTSAADAPFGSYFFKQNFKQLISFNDILAGIGLKTTALYITTDGDIQIFLVSGTSTKPMILLKADSDLQNVAENLETALTTEPLQTEFKNKYSSLMYIDLRFGNKVYYKFQM